MKLIFSKLNLADKFCQKRDPACVNEATCEVAWMPGHGSKLLCSTHKKELEENPGLLGAFFKLGKP